MALVKKYGDAVMTAPKTRPYSLGDYAQKRAGVWEEMGPRWVWYEAEVEKVDMKNGNESNHVRKPFGR